MSLSAWPKRRHTRSEYGPNYLARRVFHIDLLTFKTVILGLKRAKKCPRISFIHLTIGKTMFLFL